MPAPSKIDLLPEEVRAELNRQLVKRAFSDYEALAKWLAEQGFQIGKSTVGRYGQKLERKLAAIRAATEAARAIAAAAPDDADLRSAATISLVQTDIFDVLVTLQEAEDADPEKRLMLMSKAARAIADLARASVSQKKWAVEIRQQERERAVQAVESEAKRQGASTATIDALRAAIMQEMGR